MKNIMIDSEDKQEKSFTEKIIDDFINDCEREAAKLEITVDYYIAEFTWLFFLEWHSDLWLQSVQHLSSLPMMMLTILTNLH